MSSDWTEADTELVVEEKNHSKAVHDSKDLLKLSSMLSSAILACRQDLGKV